MCSVVKYVYNEFGLPQLMNEKEQLIDKTTDISEKLKVIMEEKPKLLENQKHFKREKLLKKRGTIYDYPETKDQQILQNGNRNNKDNNLNKVTKIWTNDKELKCYINNKIKKYHEIRNTNQQILSNGTGSQEFKNCFVPTTNNQINNFNNGFDF